MAAGAKHAAVAQEIASLAELDREALLERWRKVFAGPVPKNVSRPVMVRALAWEIQASASGGLPPRVTRALRAEARSPGQANTLPAGSRLVREWNGRTHVVDATEDGFLWNGRRFASLSGVARAITGAHWSGPRFFALNSRAGQS